MEPSQLGDRAQLAELPEKNPGSVGRLTRDATCQMANAAARYVLSTCSIVTGKHHGTTTVTSRPGRTVFTARLPLDSARSE